MPSLDRLQLIQNLDNLRFLQLILVKKIPKKLMKFFLDLDIKNFESIF